jgi:hypothetical protein
MASGLPDPVAAPRRPTYPRLFLLATVAFLWTAMSLFLELPSRAGLLGRIGWGGILVGGPLAVVLVVLALRRYGREVTAANNPSGGDATDPKPGTRSH